MDKVIWQGFVTDAAGDIVPGAEVHVKLESSGAYATLYQDETGTAWTDGNPFTIGSDGFVQFYVDPDIYRIQAFDGAQIAQFDNVRPATIFAAQAEVLSATEDQKAIAPDTHAGFHNVTTVTASTSATVDFLSDLQVAGTYTLSCSSLAFDTDGVYLRMRVSLNSTTVESGASDYDYSSFNTGTTAEATGSAIVMSANTVGNAAGETMSFSCVLHVDSSGALYVSGTEIHNLTDGTIDGSAITARYEAGGITGIQLHATSGNIASGDFTLKRIG